MPPLRCPLCHAPLVLTQHAASCEAGHSFDRARTGYLNLLPVQHKHSRQPGDDAAMVRARSEFLEGGHYAPLRDALCNQLRELQPPQMLDSGCGEGWYSAAFAACAGEVIALDISKEAIRRAARRDPKITWLVASSAELPLADASVDLMTAIFSPLKVSEAARVLRPAGSVLVAVPDARHLWELRTLLYEEVRPHQPHKWQAELAPWFDLHSETRVSFRLELGDAAAVQSLLRMTPYAWHATADRRATVAALPALSVAVEFRILRFLRAAI